MSDSEETVDDARDSILDSVIEGDRSTRVDGLETTSHSIRDRVAGAEYLENRENGKKKTAFRMQKIRPPGAV